MNILTCPRNTFESLLLHLAEDPGHPVLVRTGLCTRSQDREWLVRQMTAAPGNPHDRLLQLSLVRIAPGARPFQVDFGPLPDALVGALALSSGDGRGSLAGIVRVEDRLEPLDLLSLPGPGLPHLALLPRPPGLPDTLAPLLQNGRRSRTVGGLGGEVVWRRLAQLRIAVAGCGRTGSLVAAALARLGVRALVLVDPDRLEAHNLAEMEGVAESDIGAPKAEALAAYLARVHPGVQATPLAASVGQVDSLRLLRECDAVFCCADNDAARLAAAIAATLYHRLLIDAGTGIHFAGDSQATADRTVARRSGRDESPGLRPRTMGADVRLIVPGDGCLLCHGNLTDYAGAVEALCNARPGEAAQADWRQQRAGSLWSLNALAAATAVEMLQDLVAGRVQGSTWARLEVDASGHLAVSYPPTTARPGCSLCAKAGLGDDGLSWGGA